MIELPLEAHQNDHVLSLTRHNSAGASGWQQGRLLRHRSKHGQHAGHALGLGTCRAAEEVIGELDVRDYLAATPVGMELVVSGPITAVPAMPLWALAAMVASMLLLAIRTNDRVAASRARK